MGFAAATVQSAILKVDKFLTPEGTLHMKAVVYKEMPLGNASVDRQTDEVGQPTRDVYTIIQ